MNINFELVLVLLVAFTGIIWVLDILYLAKQRHPDSPLPWYIEWTASFFLPLLAVLLIRSFIIEPFRIPSGSLKPTLLDGDFIAVNKFAYGLRVPISNTKILKVGEPKVGDILVFHWPPNPSYDYIKRVIGVPGDHIRYINKVLYVNGQEAKQSFFAQSEDNDGNHTWPVQQYHENLQGLAHDIYINATNPIYDEDIVVPAGYYFVMGDNRDFSADSRFWGLVPENNIVGKAFWVWMSWDNITHNVRWRRMGQTIH